jgi:phosphotransferase system HPr-like phosphotransfer protein
MSDIDFIEYDKISIQSDAFVTSAELNCYFQYIPSTKAISYNIKKELHTAGTTEDPNDYKIPDVSGKILPRKLYRINPFHTNYSENLELNKVNTDPEIIFPTKIKEHKQKVIDYSSLGLNSDQIEFMVALQNLKSLKLDDSVKKLDIEQFESVDEKVMNGFFQLYPRFMEMLTSGVSSGAFNQFFDDTETTESVNENETLINETIKKLGLNPSEVRVKKKFEVRPGNSKKDEINAYLQDISLSNNVANTRSVNNNSVTNISQLNLQNNTKVDLQVRSSKSVNNLTSLNNTNLNFINNNNKTVNELITNLSKFSEDSKLDFDNLYKSFLKDLNIAPKVENQFLKVYNQHSKNLSIEFNKILNHSEKTVYETNLKNLSTSYNFYRHIENRYREFIQNLNFFNDTVEQIKQTEINLKNTYQNIHRHSVTNKNNHYKNILNLTKNVNYEYTANDYEFQYAVLKTIKNSNQYVENKISKIKNELNVAQQNISFVHHRMVHIQEKTSNFVAKEIKNVLNNTDYIDEYSNIIVNKISNISNNQTVRALLSLVTNEEQLNSIYTVLRQSNINTSNIKNLVDVINYSKNNNFEITKVSSSTVENIKNLVSLSKNVVDYNNTENQVINKLSSINVDEFKSFVNLSESKSFTRIAQSYKSISNVIENLNTTSINPKISSIRIDQKKVDNLNQIVNQSNFEFIVEKLSNFNTENITEKINLLKNINVTQDIKKTENIVRKITRLAKYNNVNQITENIDEISSLSNSEFKTEIQKLKNLINISKNVNVSNIGNLKVSQLNFISENIEKINQISQIKNIAQVRNVDQIVNNLNYINNIIEENNLVNRTSKIDQREFINAINLSKNYIQSFNRFESKISNVSQRQRIRETLQDINITNNEINNSTVQITNKTQKVQLQEFIQNLNLLETEKNTTVLNRYSFESNKKNISNLYTELNLTQQIKQEKRTEKEFARISKRLDRMNKETIKVQGNSYKVEQNFFDMMNFYNEQKVTKTSKDRKVNNFFQLLDILNVQKTTNERKVTQKIQNIEQVQNRIVNNTSQIKIDVYREKKDNYYKVDNRQTFTTNNYHQEKEEQKKTEKIVENKVEELLVKKIENVTNNLVSNVITKNEFQTIKKEIIQEIYNIEMKTEERIKDLRKETQQTVQTMLDRFLRS